MTLSRSKQAFALASLLGVAILCTFSAGDRLAQLPGHAESRLSPAWFGAGNAGYLAIRAVDQQDFASALRWASVAVSRDPIGQHTTALLALSLLGTGRPDAAQAAYTVAANTGWRDAGVQTYWMMTALALGDVNIAAQRLDALLRVGNRDDQTLAGLAALEGTPAGRSALADRLALSPDWAPWYLQDAKNLDGDSLKNRLAIIFAAARTGLKLDKDKIAQTSNALRAKGQIESAVWLWRHFGGDKNAGMAIVDGRFDNVADDSNAGPFEWALLETGGVDVHIDGNAPLHSGPALYARSSSSTTKRIAQQTLMLPPGSYSIHWQSADSTGGRSSNAAIHILCNGTTPANGPADAIRQTGRNGSILNFTVPETGCASQLVAIELHPGTGLQDSPSWIDDVSIARASATN
jgi:hypothetical protein